MAVRQLAGPFTIKMPPQEGGVVPVPKMVMWWPGVGGIVQLDQEDHGFVTGIMTLDGVFCDRSDSTFEGAGWWPAKSALIQYLGPQGFEVVYDPLALVPELSESQEANTGHPLAGKVYAKLQDRSIYFADSSFKVVVNASVITTEGPPAPFNDGFIGPGRSKHELFVYEDPEAGEPVRALFYDTRTKNWSSLVFTIDRPCSSFAFVPEFGVMISLHTPADDPTLHEKSQVRIWSLEVKPTIISPVEIVAGEPKSGQIVTYQVQVTGDDDDPAVGELVDWALVGGSAGELLDRQSKTDVNGYAQARVAYVVGETGSTDIEASLAC